ncbi:MAG: TetR/AcrR family transcriptional regulator [Lachnospiraceae bacterium]|nr:TetR/AcrR family transcriptional regulator [Lachnospiraceae bacterium]
MGYDYDQTHEKIVESAIAHFKDKGYSGASIRQICKDAGVTNGAFYAHFDSKEDLFSSIVSPVVDGMKEIYDAENSHYMDIETVEDVRNVLKETFSSNRKLIRYVFEHAGIFRIILSGGAGTEYEGFCDDLAEEEASNTRAFLDRLRQITGKNDLMSETLIRHISRLLIYSAFEGLSAGRSEDEVVKETELASEFCLAGMKHFLGI